ncbi:DUF4248 domain-containing protein [Flavobacterium sp.]|uniref:DUF4248 domain-containing protein n=1 Tax=Flavobacterium sp. TaxID=239 RepID=UPI003BE84CBE
MKKIQTRVDLADFYGVSVKIINNWLKEIKMLGIKPYQRIFTPKQIQAIIEYLGTP